MGFGTFILGGVIGFVVASILAIPIPDKAKDINTWKSLGEMIIHNLIEMSQFIQEISK